ncbi:tRNA (guanosine(37)-N1)-methyltransferase TrmD [Patescibacteria group bacterium]|nr:tRNA (guanosine(37)-N1)-methyltransferase TrmD [Patescibacteria group bacterium]MBU1890137.1 tRNA (guanosine(37)-N1)-methyltransferase TrmD [Patescibacteria group bacterium]
MRFDILTIFPKIFQSYFDDSIIKRAQNKKLVTIKIHDLRDGAKDKHRATDDRPYGGGPGMVMKVEPIYNTLKKIGAVKSKKAASHRVILLTPQGNTLTQKTVKRLSKYKIITLICGRYEGFDERVRSLVDEQISIGDYVLTGGELPAMVVVDTLARFVPGVLGHDGSVKDESFSKSLQTLEYPQYTRPEIFRRKRVPPILLSGNHQLISEWRKKHQRTKHR